MNLVKIRRLLILAHLYIAALLAPAFILVGATGALYVAGVKGAETETSIAFAPDAQLDPSSPTLETDLRDVLGAAGIEVDFEYLIVRPGMIMTRPTSREYVRLDLSGEGLSGAVYRPDLPKALMELHKGHGPRAFRVYQIAMGSMLVLVALGGLLVGLLAASYRRATIIATLIGSGIFAALAFLA
ncbi:MAG: hypothetical protein GC152_02930 [Alphaproteobacteria bacterium]|nr:hypothetical protein [Alphaproteobacteria bacterium]